MVKLNRVARFAHKIRVKRLNAALPEAPEDMTMMMVRVVDDDDDDGGD